MKKKHYELIASAFKQFNTIDVPEHESSFGEAEADDVSYGGNRCARLLADAFERDNPKFNRAKFLQACGVTA